MKLLKSKKLIVCQSQKPTAFGFGNYRSYMTGKGESGIEEDTKVLGHLFYPAVRHSGQKVLTEKYHG